MFYTGKGDGGTTKLFGCNASLTKTARVFKALGVLDELNSLLGLCKVHAAKEQVKIPSHVVLVALVTDIQHTLFIIQAELAGSKNCTVSEQKIQMLEQSMHSIESQLPPITTFILSGGTECAAWCDFARAYARKAERHVLEVVEEGTIKMGHYSCVYLNRLSSALYAYARWTNHQAGISEVAPHYEKLSEKC